MLRLSRLALFNFVLLAGMGTMVHAQDHPLKALKDQTNQETLAAALPLLADPALRGNLRSMLFSLDPFPAKELVSLLSHPQLAVRLGALEALEEKAAGDFNFNPWATHDSPENEASLALWKKWLGDSTNSESSSLLSSDQRHSYLRDLLADDQNRAARARRMMEADGLSSVGFLEDFLAKSETLPAGSRAKVREAQYQIVLSNTYGPQASNLARQLAFGSRDQTLAAIGSLKSAGLSAIPIIRDFLNHTDALVRETAMDAILATGGSEALSIVGPALMQETDPNVIHGALRRLKEIPGDESLQIAVSFLNREEEDLLISAIQACQKLCGGDPDDYSTVIHLGRGGKNKSSDALTTANQAVIKALSDPRWRVRTAALEFIAAVKVKEAGDKCVELINDPDEFVRFSAIKAATSLGQSAATPLLEKILLDNPSSLGSILEGYAALGAIPDEEMMKKFASYSPDARIAAINAATVAGKKLSFIPLRFASDPDLDVACAALRYLSSDEQSVGKDKIATILVEALRSGIPEKIAAVLDRIELPSNDNKSMDPRLMSELSKFAETPEKTSLDPIYDSLLGAAEKSKPASDPNIKVLPGAKRLLTEEILKIARSDNPNSFRAALTLGIVGNTDALAILLENLPKYSTAQRAAIAGGLYNPSSKEAYDVLHKLLRDPIDEIRTDAIDSALSSSFSSVFISMVLDALTEPGSKVTPHQLYSYRFSSLSNEDNASTQVIIKWATKTVSDTSASDSQRILALIALSQNLPNSAVEPALTIAKSSPNKWLRRAAWHALGSSTTSAFRDNLQFLAKDDSPHVRAVLPEVRSRLSSTWKHRFDDVNLKSNSSWDSSRGSRRIHPSETEVLVKFSESDPSPDVRFESMLTLLTHGKEIDADEFATLLRSRPKEDRASNRVAEWMNGNLERLGPGMAPIISALNPTEVSPNYMRRILGKLSSGEKKGAAFTSFASLVENSQKSSSSPQLIAVEEQEKPEIVRESLQLVYFFKPGCAECEKADRLLDSMLSKFPKLRIDRHNINETQGTLLNQALCGRFNVPSAEHNIAPAIFTQAGFLIRSSVTPPALGKLLSDTMNLPEDNSWSLIDEPELAIAKKEVETRYQSLTLPVVLVAGLIDGLNPCAFATIIFFLSYLQIARRSTREMIMVGLAFISAVFIAYFSAGLLLHSILEQITSRISGVKPYFDWFFAGLALIAAIISFRDALKAKAGKLDEMTLSLPGFLKDRIRGVIRTGARARRFVIAAFLAGIAISFLELACTGQVYTPIIYSIQQGRGDAVAWLLAYNLAFIIPLIVIFALALTGMSNKALIDFQTRHTFSVKIAIGLVFLALAAVILFGTRLL